MEYENILAVLCLGIALHSNAVFGDDPLECSYTYTYKTWTKMYSVKDPKVKDPELKKVMTNVDFIFNLYCVDQIAMISYDNHILDKFRVQSCNKDELRSDILIENQEKAKKATQDERELPTEVKIYFNKNRGRCYSRTYSFKNWVGVNVDVNMQRDAGVVTSRDPKKENKDCKSGNENLEVFSKCKTGRYVLNNVSQVEYVMQGKGDWYPTALDLDPPGLKTDQDVPHTKLLACSYKTGSFLFKILCIQDDLGYSAYVGEEDPQSVFMDRFRVTSCQEDHIVNSIFPPNYSNRQPATGPTHKIIFAYYREKCQERNYKCAATGRAIKDPQPSETKCPSRDDLHPTTGSLGKWENCKGLVTSPQVIDLTKA